MFLKSQPVTSFYLHFISPFDYFPQKIEAFVKKYHNYLFTIYYSKELNKTIYFKCIISINSRIKIGIIDLYILFKILHYTNNVYNKICFRIYRFTSHSSKGLTTYNMNQLTRYFGSLVTPVKPSHHSLRSSSQFP